MGCLNLVAEGPASFTHSIGVKESDSPLFLGVNLSGHISGRFISSIIGLSPASSAKEMRLGLSGNLSMSASTSMAMMGFDPSLDFRSSVGILHNGVSW